MKKTIFCLVFFVTTSLIVSNDLFGWDNDVTHKDLSEYAAKNSVLDISKGNYMKTLGFNNGLTEKFVWMNKSWSVLLWLRDGAFYEDAGSIPQGIAGTARYINHFHNPLKPWTEAGLNDTVVGFHYAGESSLLWAQDSTKQSGWLGGDWTWQATRIFFYNALTKSTNTERQAYFAQMFRGLGHQMHLIQDASQPDHVRNDAHPWSHNQVGELNIESWAKDRSSDINKLAANPQMPTLSLDPSAYSLDSSYNNRHLTPAALFIDTDQYNGAAPSTGLTQGIAEYTNANFASEHTIFAEQNPTSDKHYFPYPRKSSTNLQNYMNQLPETVIAEDGVADVGFWIAKTGDGETYSHFAKPTYLTNKVTDRVDNGYLYSRTFYQDDECHKDYAQLLIPRAVGYSAGLLNYFFRGQVSLVPTGDAMDQYVIINSSTEQLSGTFSLYYDDASGNRILVKKWDNMIISAATQTGQETIPGESSLVTFPTPTTPAPKEKNIYFLVFQGQMGNEEGAVAGRVVRWWREEWNNDLKGNHPWLYTCKLWGRCCYLIHCRPLSFSIRSMAFVMADVLTPT
jgi:hypothetical protein